MAFKSDRIKLLIDGDILVNKACFSVEKRTYQVMDDNIGYFFKTKREALAYTDGDVSTITKLKDVGSFDNVRFSINQMLSKIHYNVGLLGRIRETVIYLGPVSGQSTFRHEIATAAVYKGNRKPEDRPYHIGAARDYLIHSLKAVMAVGMEADDMLGIELSKAQDRAVVASIDKDLLQLPGMHYNIDRAEFTEATDPGDLFITKRKNGKKDLKGYGFKWFCAQMLLGDPVDNITKPIKGLGDVKAYKKLKKTKTCREAWAVVEKVYEGQEDLMKENAVLLWILRHETSTYEDVL